MELKLTFCILCVIITVTFNRTSMELKPTQGYTLFALQDNF